jgi:hypothetical protein
VYRRLRQANENDTSGVLQDLNDGVEEDAVEAGVIEAKNRLMVFDEGVHGEPRGLGSRDPPPMIAKSAAIWGFQGAEPLA